MTVKIDVLPIKEIPREPKIRCMTCGEIDMDLWRGKFPICDECLKVLREIIRERRK